MPQGVPGPLWPPNYIPTPDEWQAAFAAGAVGRGVIQSMPCQLSTMMIYGVRTGVGAFNCILPPLSTTKPGDWIILFDMEYNADANPTTFTATGPDAIACYGGQSTTLTANVADYMVAFIADPSYWRAVVRLA